MTQVIIVGGGLAGLSAAHTVLEHGGRALLLDKSPFCGGNSTKATSGINGALTRSQIAKGSKDTVENFERDTARGSGAVYGQDVPATPLIKTLAAESGPAIEWLIQAFGLDLSIVGRMGGHSESRTHRGKERFPGMTITYGQLEKYEEICKEKPHMARLINKARVVRLLKEGDSVVGCVYERQGKQFTEYGSVIIATGGFGADFAEDSLLKKYRPDLMHLPTTNGSHCTGDGMKLAYDAGADLVDMEIVQVHPTGLVAPKDPKAKTKFLAAEALRGCGGIILDREGNRMCDELGRRDYVTGELNKGKGPFRLILNGGASNEINWHCKHYVGRGLMIKYNQGADLAKAMNISPEHLEQTFNKYNDNAKNKNCPFGKKYFFNVPLKMDDFFHVAIITPVIHYCLGGVKVDTDARIHSTKGAIPGLYATGEVCGGIHGKNRLGGNSLLDCVVFGRLSGRAACKDMLINLQTMVGKAQTQGMNLPGSVSRLQTMNNQLVMSKTNAVKTYTKEEVAKHNTEKDCWAILFDKVYDVTNFLEDHPGGKEAIMLYAGVDATEQFDMLHQPSVLKKFGPPMYIGDLAK